MMAADDQGTQNGTILPPEVYGQLYAPAYRRITDAAHTAAPDVKLFLHCCGAVYDLLEHVIAGGFDALNPVQWSGGRHGYREWKDVCRGRIALWGGGVNSQVTLPLGTVAEVEAEAHEAAAYLSKDSGYVFCAIHNLLAEIAPEKMVALYRAVG
jgi:uroporphyrinogen decarboxylase